MFWLVDNNGHGADKDRRNVKVSAPKTVFDAMLQTRCKSTVVTQENMVYFLLTGIASSLCGRGDEDDDIPLSFRGTSFVTRFFPQFALFCEYILHFKDRMCYTCMS